MDEPTTEQTEVLTIKGFVDKRVAAERFKRSHRQLGRDITDALKVKDVEFLDNLRLETRDGKIRKGTDVSIETLDELRDQKQVPTWWANPIFLEEKYGTREDVLSEDHKNNNDQKSTTENAKAASNTSSSSEPPLNPTANDPRPPASFQATLPPLPSDLGEQTELLKHLYLELQQNLHSERQRNDAFFAVVESIPTQQNQTNVLLREFQELMKEGRISPSVSRAMVPTTPTGTTTKAQHDYEDAEFTDATTTTEEGNGSESDDATTEKEGATEPEPPPSTPKKVSPKKKPAGTTSKKPSTTTSKPKKKAAATKKKSVSKKATTASKTGEPTEQKKSKLRTFFGL